MSERDMNSAPLELLARVLEAASPDAVIPVPASWLRALLPSVPDAPEPRRPDLPPPDLTVADLAERYRRAPATVREWLERGEIVGAYKLGREWRVPPAAVLDFDQSRRRARSSSPAGLSGWREEYRGPA